MIENLKKWLDISEAIIHDVKIRTNNLEPKECGGCTEKQSCSRDDYVKFLGHVVMQSKSVLNSVTEFLDKLQGKQSKGGSLYS